MVGTSTRVILDSRERDEAPLVKMLSGALSCPLPFIATQGLGLGGSENWKVVDSTLGENRTLLRRLTCVWFSEGVFGGDTDDRGVGVRGRG